MEQDLLQTIQALKDDVEVTLDDLEFIKSKIDSGELENLFEIVEIINTKIENLKLQKGEKGDSYVLTAKDKKEIAASIKVPVVEKIIEKTETIIEQPIVTNEIKEVAVSDTGEHIVSKINELPTESENLKIDASHIKNLPEFIKDDKRIGFGSMLKEAPNDSKYYARKNKQWQEVQTVTSATIIAALGYTPENVANKSSSYTASSTTTYANTKALVDGLATKQNTLGFTPEDVANKSTSTSLGTSNTLYPSQNAVKTYADKDKLIAEYHGVTTVTLTTGSTLYNLQSVLIPANTFTTGDSVYIRVICGKNVGGATARIITIKVNTSINTSGQQIALFNSASSGNRYILAVERITDIVGTGMRTFEPTASAVSDVSNSTSSAGTNIYPTVTIDWTVDQYINVLGSSISSAVDMEIYHIEVWRYRI